MSQPNPRRLLERTVRGTSMDQAGLVPGTVIFIDPELTPEHGDLVAVHVATKGDTVKRLRVSRKAGRNAGSWLVPESTNPRWQAQRFTDDLTVIGVVVGFLPPGATEVCQDVSGAPRRPPAVIDVYEVLAAKMHLGQALAQTDMPPLAYYLEGLRGGMSSKLAARRVPYVWAPERREAEVQKVLAANPMPPTAPEFAHLLGIHPGDLDMILGGYVPDPATLTRMARRLNIAAAELLRFGKGGRSDGR